MMAIFANIGLSATEPAQKIHIVIVGPKADPNAKKLYTAATAYSNSNTEVTWWDRKEGPLKNSDVSYPLLDKSAVYVCHAFQCSLPIFQAENLSTLMKKITTLPEPAIANTPKPKLHEVAINNPLNAEELLAGKNWFFIIFGFIGLGLLLSFTPCILPLVPIMASIIVGQTIGVKKEKTFLLCCTYVFSMSLTYSFLGLMAGIFGLYLQIYMQKTWIIILFSLIFFTLALSMLGAFELKLPRFFQQKITDRCNLQKGGSYLGVMGMGIFATLIVSPCVTAPLAGVLGFITRTSDYLLGAIALFFLGLGMGVPLLIISLFSRNILPKAARWNIQIRTFFGLILLWMSIWIVSRVIPDLLSMVLFSALLILTAVHMGITKRKTKTLFHKCWKTLTIMIFVCGVAILLNALFINTDFYNKLIKNRLADSANTSMTVVPIFKDIKNKDELNRAINSARTAHMPVLLDFTAKWCTACVRMNRDVFTDSNVMNLFNKFYLLQVDLTNSDSDKLNLARQFNVAGPPIILFFGKQGQLMTIRATGDLDVNQFTQIMRDVLAEYNK